MPERFDSVLDRIGAFNLATERLSKGRGREMRCHAVERPSCWLRLTRTEDNYGIHVSADAVLPDKQPELADLRFQRDGESFFRPVSKAERSWNVASQLEDLLTDVCGLPAHAVVEIDFTD